MAFKLDPNCALGPELARVIREQLARAAEKVAQKGVSTRERIHFARTSCKKARAALKLARAHDKNFYRRENRLLSQAARKLSGLRDVDVMVDTLDHVIAHGLKPDQRRKFEPVRRALLAHRRTSAPSRAELERRLTRFAQRLRESGRRLAGWEPADDFAAWSEGFRRTYKWARSALFAAEALASAETFHEWRKATKAYAYQCRLLRAAWPPAMKELRAELKELARRLGDEHDLTMLRQHLRKLYRKGILNVGEKVFRATLALVELRQEGLRDEAIPWGKRLFADRPRTVAARMTQWWRVAQEEPEARAVASLSQSRSRGKMPPAPKSAA